MFADFSIPDISLTQLRRPLSATYFMLFAAVHLLMADLHLVRAVACQLRVHPDQQATGFDRLMSILCKTESIRDVIAFPKTGSGTDPLFKSPAPVSLEILSQYGIRSN